MIVFSRANNARSKAHSAEIYAKQARYDSVEARKSAKAAAPDFRQPGNEIRRETNNDLSSFYSFRRRKTTTIHPIGYR